MINSGKCLDCDKDRGRQAKRCMACHLKTLVGEGNPGWKGDKAKYGSIHDWVKYHMKKPDRCTNCEKIGKVDTANISGKYLRDLSDWEWLCRRCHMSKDGRLQKFKGVGRNKPGWEYKPIKYNIKKGNI